MTRRRVLGGIVTVGAASAAVGAGTFAFFSDTETSSNNQVTAGTLDLTGAANGAISISNAAPGDTLPNTGTYEISATYDADSTIDPVEVDLSVTNSEPSSEPSEPSNSTDQSASAFAEQLTVDTANLRKDGSVHEDLTSTQSVSTADDLGGLSLDDAFGDVSPGTTVGLELAFTFDSGAGNAFQADGLAMDVQFVGQQPGED
ncbi:TasA family protein [Haloarcula salina]|uniref:TasA family protein n=1 Tax=Haloarcula salina TaxID=1429914 RepID=UPI003C6F5786